MLSESLLHPATVLDQHPLTEYWKRVNMEHMVTARIACFFGLTNISIAAEQSKTKHLHHFTVCQGATT